ncbi:MAG: ribonuclease P protein component [Ruminococcus sp.]|nr:ribonuclease P protein component [Ruminococcus sp.]
MLFTLRLKDNRGFLNAYKKGGYVSDANVVVYFVANKSPYNRLGISVSKKIGGAVERNRAKRIIRAAYRECEKYVPIGYDLVFVARAGIGDKRSTDIERFIRKRLIDRINKKAGKK